jgi:hypothetical protein
MGFRREKRLTEYPVHEAVEVSYQRSKGMDKLTLQTWSEATAVNIDRLLTEYRKGQANAAIEAHHQALQLVGMTRAIMELATVV